MIHRNIPPIVIYQKRNTELVILLNLLKCIERAVSSLLLFGNYHGNPQPYQNKLVISNESIRYDTERDIIL